MSDWFRMAERAAVKRWGRPNRVDGSTALARIGKAAEVHPDDVYAYRLPTKLAAKVFSLGNSHECGLPTIDMYCDNDGTWVTVVDLRPALTAEGIEARPVDV